MRFFNLFWTVLFEQEGCRFNQIHIIWEILGMIVKISYNFISNEVTETMQCMKSWTPRSQQDLYNPCDARATKHPMLLWHSMSISHRKSRNPILLASIVSIEKLGSQHDSPKKHQRNAPTLGNPNFCRQLLCCTPIKKTRCSTRHHGSALFQAPDWQISTSRGSAPEIDRGRGVSLRFRCYICFIRWHFVCIVFFCLFCFVVLCLFLFGISSMDHFIACCKTSLTTTTRFILLYLPWWSVNPIFGKNNLEKAHRSCPWPHCSSHKKKRPYFPWNSGCLWGSLRMVYEIIPYIWIPFGFM